MNRKKKVVALCLAVCLLVGLLPTAALAGGEDTGTLGSLDLSDGSITITENGYTQEDSTTETEYTGTYTITHTQDNETSTDNTITVESGIVDMTITGLNVVAEDAPAIYVKAGATLNLTVEGTNSLTGGAGYAGISVAAGWDSSSNFSVADSGHLVIQGTGILSTQGGDAVSDEGIGGGAGIGGNGFGTGNFDGGDFGVIEILSGTVSATGGNAVNLDHGAGAGIGGGGGNNCGDDDNKYTVIWSYSGNISIQGGTVTAHGGAAYNDCCAGAGIGSGSPDADHGTTSDDLHISITGGVVEAHGGVNAAAIGGGVNGDCGTLTITGGEIRAYGGGESSSSAYGGAGIGGGDSAGGGSIAIGGTADVSAQGGGAAAGIGGGNGGYVGNIVIEGSADVTAVGGNPTGRTIDDASDMRGGAGIGAGNNNNFGIGEESSKLTLNSSGTVIAYGGMGAQAIGMGTNPPSDKSYEVEIGNNAEIVWMFNYDQVQSAVYGVSTDNTMNFSELSVPYHTIFWHNSTGEPTGGTAYACKENGTVDGATYSWSTLNNTVSITKGTTEILSGRYDPDLHDAYDNWAVIYREAEPITISLADLIIYVGGEGYESVVTDEDGNSVGTESDGLPEPGFTVELPDAVDAALKESANHTSSEPLDLSDYLSFAYNDGEDTTRTWTLERYDDKEGNSSMADGKYIYRIVPAEGQEPVRLQFTDEDNNVTTSDDFDIVLNDQYQVYEMTIYPGALDPEHLQAVITYTENNAEEKTETFDLEVESANLTIRGVVDNEDGESPTTEIVTTDPTNEVPDITAQVPVDTKFFINDSTLEVENWNEVQLLVDHIIPTAQETLLERALTDFASRLTEEHNYEFHYLDLVDTSNGNVWVTASKDVTLYWPYPEGTDKNTEFFIVHYQGLDRQYDDLESQKYDTKLYAADADTQSDEPTLENTDQGIKITVDSFSPFALFWKSNGGSSPPDTSNPDPIYYTLHYESNGGTEYDDERYRPNTFVTLDKVPVREGYTFTGWYADEALTEKITDVTMNRDRTVYAGWEPTGVPEWLNGDDHFAYVIGYPDGTVRPLGQITRAEVATIFFRLLKEEVRSENLATENPFSDVTTKNWFHTAVSTMTALGIVQGRTADTFVPNAPITRAEFAAICARFDTGHTDGDSSFTDIAGHWAEAEIERAATLGWIMGYEDGTFRPDRPITRAEAMTLINRVLNRLPQDESDLLEDMNIWPDNQPGDWYYLAVQEATNTHDFLRKGEIYETWTQMLEDPNWIQYEITS